MHLAMYCVLTQSTRKLQHSQYSNLNRTHLSFVTDAFGNAAPLGGVWEVGEEWYSS